MRRFCYGMMPVLASLFLAGCSGSSNTSSSSSTGTTGAGGAASLVSITVSPAQATIAQGTAQAFTAMGKYSDGSTKDVTATARWSSLLSSVASVSNNPPTQGLATALVATSGSGTTYPISAPITASSGGVSGSGQLTITSATPASIALTPATATLGYLNPLQYRATVTFSDGSKQDVTNLPAVFWGVSSGPPLYPAPPFYTLGSGLVIGSSMGEFTVSATFSTNSGTVSTSSATTQPMLTVDLSNLTSVALVPVALSNPAAPSIANNTQVQFLAIGTFSDGSTRDVTSLVPSYGTGSWASDNAEVTNFGAEPNIFSAAVSSGLPVTANITATITDPVSSATFNLSAPLTVSAATLQSIAVAPATATLAAGTKVDFTAVGTFSDGSTQTLTSPQVKWSAQPGSGAATIDKGTVTGISAGSLTVVAAGSTALGATISGTATATITSATLQSIAISPSPAFMIPGNNLAFTATGTFSDASMQDVTASTSWTSSAKNIATVTKQVATGQAVGLSTITAKTSGMTTTTNLMVVLPSQVQLAVSGATAPIAVGATSQFTATGTFTDGTTQDFTSLVNWSSSTPATATVDYQTGVVTGLAAGSSTITATLGSVTATGQVTMQ